METLGLDTTNDRLPFYGEEAPETDEDVAERIRTTGYSDEVRQIIEGLYTEHRGVGMDALTAWLETLETYARGLSV